MPKTVTRFELTLACLLLSALFACRGLTDRKKGDSLAGGESKPAASGAPLVLTWEQPYKLTTGTKAGATFFATKDAGKPTLKLEASFHDFAAGTKIHIGEAEALLSEGAFHSTLLDIKQAILDNSLEDLKGPVDVNIELHLEVPGLPAAKTKLPKQDLKESLRYALLKAQDGGITFGPSDIAAGKPRSAAIVAGYSDLDFVGTGKSIIEVDWVVYSEDQKEPRTTKQCAYKQGNSTLKVFDANVIVFERRTGKRIKEHVLKASERCPMIAYVSKEDNSTKTSVMANDVTTWARGELK